MPAPPLAIDPLIDEILAEHREFSEGDEVGWAGYRNHAQRVFIFASRLAEPRSEAGEMIAIAAAFHDLAVFRTLDYLVPNLEALDTWLATRGRPEWRREVGLAITMHHRVRPYRGEAAWLVEPMRRADWIEVTGGVMTAGVPRELVRRAQRELPLGSFASKSGLRIAAHAATHPLDPLPFWRSRSALRHVE
jgi:hypothetical protein